MPSSKRAQKGRRDIINDQVDIPDSSPSRPAKRRKKEKTEEPPPDLPTPYADLPETIPIEQESTSLVTSQLSVPYFVQVREDHADSRHEQTNGDGISAFAKLSGKDFTYYIKVLKIVLGRPPEGSNTNLDPEATDDENMVHVDLGPSKLISRQHAVIYYKDDWFVSVNGRNGVRVDTKNLIRGESHKLHCGSVIEIGGVEMMFVLPQPGSLHVHKNYLARAGLVQSEETADDSRKGHRASTPDVLPAAPRNQNSAPLPIAPAPKNYQRPGTPSSSHAKKGLNSDKPSPGAYDSGIVLMNPENSNVDLSIDSSFEIKPTYSYAQLITQAIINAPDERVTLAGIYEYITKKYAYYRFARGGGWQNSIRHNLSLSKAFYKVEREKDEPGKGMKWCIREEWHDEMVKNCVRGGRGGHRGSSLPGSPLNHARRNSREPIDPSSAIKEKPSPDSGSPRRGSYPPNAPQFTPDRAHQVPPPQNDFLGDGSPLPRHRRSHNNTVGLSDNIPGSPPTLSSSYQQDEGNTFVTPAPHRVHPHLAPPSTAQRPSQHMPTSSPAPFWKFAGIESTPFRGNSFDISPIKGSRNGPNLYPSSSPPPIRRASAMSPTRNGMSSKLQIPEVDELEEEEERGFDLSKGFQSIGSYHAPVANLSAPGSGLTTRP